MSQMEATATKGARVYTIHSLDEIEVDTRVQRIAALTEEEARNLTTQIQRTSARLWLLVTEAHDRKAHQALGYDTWADYVRAELNMSESRSYQFLDTGHVMKALASAGVNVDSFSPPPVRVVNRVKDRLTEVRKVAAQAVSKAEGDPVKAVDKAIRALAREPRRNGEGAEGTTSTQSGPTVVTQRGSKPVAQVPCPVCAGSGKVTQSVADKMLELIQKYVK
jgi:hypothetical protein